MHPGMNCFSKHNEIVENSVNLDKFVFKNNYVWNP